MFINEIQHLLTYNILVKTPQAVSLLLGASPTGPCQQPSYAPTPSLSQFAPGTHPAYAEYDYRTFQLCSGLLQLS